MFFSEEKNQKTFNSTHAYRSRQWPDRLNLLKDKSLLVLAGRASAFFRKEWLSWRMDQC
jgi:hypothetical protein